MRSLTKGLPNVVRLAAVAGIASVPLFATASGAAEPETELGAAAAGYDLALSNTVLSYTPTADAAVGEATFRVNVCNQSTDSTPSGAASFTFVAPGGAGYPGPPAFGTVRAAPNGNILDVPLTGSLAGGACESFDIPVSFSGQTSPFVTVAEISASGADVDSTPSPTPAAGVGSEDDRLASGDALTVDTDPSEDDRDIAVQVLSAQATTTTTSPTTSTTAPPVSTTLLTTTPTTAAPGPGVGVSPGTLPITGSVDGDARNPLVLLGVALPVSWFGAVLALRARRLSGAGR